MSKLYFKDENNEEYIELKSVPIQFSIDTEKEDNIDYNKFNEECSFEIRDKETIRKLKKLTKTQKDKQEELKYNKTKFRNFIRNRK